MKKLWKLGAVLAVFSALALLFTACPEEKATTPPAATGIVLQVSNPADFDGEPYTLTVAPDGFNAGEVRTFTAVVNGAAKVSKKYKIDVTTTPASGVVTVSNNGKETVTVTVPTPSVAGTITVTATANAKDKNGKTVKTAWTIATDPTQAYKDPNFIETIALKAVNSVNPTVTLTEKPHGMFQKSTWYFGLEITGQGPFDKTFTIDTSTSTATASDITVSVEPSGDFAGWTKVVVADAADEAKLVTLVATANGLDVDGQALSPATWADIKINPTWTNVGLEWVFVNLNATPDGATTASLAAALNSTTKRYEIFNNEKDSFIDANDTDVVGGNSAAARKKMRDSTLVYLNKPIVADMSAFRAYGIEARVRITGDITNAASLTQTFGRNVMLGFMTKPPASGELTFAPGASATNPYGGLAENPEKAPDIVGSRIQQNGQWRSYITRMTANDATGLFHYAAVDINSATSPSVTPDFEGGYNTDGEWVSKMAKVPLKEGQLTGFHTNIHQNDSNVNKVMGHRGYELILRVMRSKPSEWLLMIFDNEGNYLYSRELIGGTNTVPTLLGDDPHYPCVIITGVKAEVSDLKIFHDIAPNAVVISDGAALKGMTPAWVDPDVVTETPINDAKEIKLYSDLTGSVTTYEVEVSSIPPTGITVDYQVIPVTMDQTVTWEMSDTSNATLTMAPVSTNPFARNFRGITSGTPALADVTVTVTSTGGTNANTVSNTFIIKVIQDYDPATSVTINTPAADAVVPLGGSLELSATVEPSTSNPNVTWILSTSATSHTAALPAGVAAVQGGRIVNLGPSTSTDVYIYAQSVKTNTVRSTPVKVTVQPVITFQPGTTYSWDFGDEEGISALGYMAATGNQQQSENGFDSFYKNNMIILGTLPGGTASLRWVPTASAGNKQSDWGLDSHGITNGWIAKEGNAYPFLLIKNVPAGAKVKVLHGANGNDARFRGALFKIAAAASDFVSTGDSNGTGNTNNANFESPRMTGGASAAPAGMSSLATNPNNPTPGEAFVFTPVADGVENGLGIGTWTTTSAGDLYIGGTGVLRIFNVFLTVPAAPAP